MRLFLCAILSNKIIKIESTKLCIEILTLCNQRNQKIFQLLLTIILIILYSFCFIFYFFKH